MTNPESECNAAKSLVICSLFESEVLVRLILHYWNHPLADDLDFRVALLETATDVLNAATSGDGSDVFIEGVPARDMNLIAALWYAENRALDELSPARDDERQARLKWLTDVRRALPSCFCPVDILPPEHFG